MRIGYRAGCALSIVISLSGCLRTELSPAPLDKAVIQLAHTAAKPIALQVVSPPEISEHALVGNQYLFVLLPFGSIRLARPLDEVFEKSYRALSLAGFRPLPGTPVNSGHLKITLRAISLSGFDLLFIRRVHCSITLDGEYIDQRGTTWTTTVTQDQGELRRQAFEPQLRHLLNSSMDRAVERLLRQLRLTSTAQNGSGG
ncbi:MAG: hypothetical protein K1X83_07675 [Oligoflexia bacterium]|nr:hypothetical protein [Oligoflexia bacterium]